MVLNQEIIEQLQKRIAELELLERQIKYLYEHDAVVHFYGDTSTVSVWFDKSIVLIPNTTITIEPAVFSVSSLTTAIAELEEQIKAEKLEYGLIEDKT